jgi:hypothetical protein
VADEPSIVVGLESPGAVRELQCLLGLLEVSEPISAARSHEYEESKSVKLSNSASVLSQPLKFHECSIIISSIAYKV